MVDKQYVVFFPDEAASICDSMEEAAFYAQTPDGFLDVNELGPPVKKKELKAAYGRRALYQAQKKLEVAKAELEKIERSLSMKELKSDKKKGCK